MKKSIAVIGLGRFGIALCMELSKLNVEVIAIDENKEAVSKVSEFVRQAFACNSTKLASLKEIGLKEVDHAIITIGQNDSSTLVSTITTTIMLKKLGIPKITVRLDDEVYRETLLDIGATEIISPLNIAADRIANRLALDNVLDYFKISNEFNIFDIKIGEQAETITLLELNSPKVYKVNILLIKREGVLITPGRDDVIQPNDEVYAFGKKAGILKLDAFLNKKSR